MDALNIMDITIIIRRHPVYCMTSHIEYTLQLRHRPVITSMYISVVLTNNATKLSCLI